MRKLIAKPTAINAKPAAAKPGKPASKPAAPVAAEAKPEATPANVERAARIAADRSAVRAFYSALESNRASVPVKPLSAFKPAPSSRHPIDRNPSTRQAAAIAAAFIGSGSKLAAGASASRAFERDGMRVCIENGAMRDMLASGLVTVSGNGADETLTLTKAGATYVPATLGEKLLKSVNLL